MPGVDRICFSIGNIHVYWYGVLMATGIVIAILLASIEGRRKKLYPDAIIDMCLWMLPMGVLGARLYYVLFAWEYYAANPISALYIWEGGLAIYGAIIGGVIGLTIFARRKKIRALKLLDCVAPGLVLAQAIGRWGNFFNQEAFGLPVTGDMLASWPILQYFPFSVYIEGAHSFNGVYCTNPLHLGTFFYESMWCLAVFILLWCIRKRFKHDGDAFLLYAMLYAFERMFVEGLRGDSLYLIQPETLSFLSGGLRVSQLLSFAIFVGVGVFFCLRAYRERRLGALIWPAPEAVGETAEEDGGETVDGAGEDAAAEDAAAQEDAASEDAEEIAERTEEDGEAGRGEEC